MKSRRPYLIRALYEWIVDSDATPFILVKVNGPGVVVPPDYVTDGQITLNIAPTAVRDLVIGDDIMTFDGRFSGQSVAVTVPLGSVGAVYARETGDGMLFDTERARNSEVEDKHGRLEAVEDAGETDEIILGSIANAAEPGSSTESKASRRAPHLKVVK